MNLNPDEIFFTDICYIKSTQEYVDDYIAQINKFLACIYECWECGSPVGIDDAFLFDEEKLCKKCKDKRKINEY